MFKAILESKRIRNAILFTILIMFIYQLGRSITIPGIDIDALYGGVSQSSILIIMSLISGGALERMSLFALGVSPLITASIVVELLSMDVIPILKEWHEEGQKGRAKLNRLNQILGTVLALLQSFALVYTFDKQYGVLLDSSPIGYMHACIILTAGTLFLGWLGNKITEYGVGNGLSSIILFGILAGLPSIFTGLYNEIFGRITTSPVQNILTMAIFVILYLLTIILVIYLDSAIRKVKVHYPGKKFTTGTNLTHLPIKVNTASVVPVIFASSFMSAPLMILSWFNYEAYQNISSKIGMGTPIGLVIFAVLIIFFTIFYSHSLVNPEKVSKDLSKGGGYIPGVRPGKETIDYISKILNRTVIISAVVLVVLSLLPYLLTSLSGLSSTSAIGGTSVLLISGIILDILETIKANISQGKYKEWGIKK